MKTKELIKILNEIDPEGETEVVIENESAFFAYKEPAYYDGIMELILKNENGEIIGGKYSSKGSKISLRPYGIMSAIYDFPELSVEYDIANSKKEEYKKMVEQWRIESREIDEEFKPSLCM